MLINHWDLLHMIYHHLICTISHLLRTASIAACFRILYVGIALRHKCKIVNNWNLHLRKLATKSLPLPDTKINLMFSWLSTNAMYAICSILITNKPQNAHVSRKSCSTRIWTRAPREKYKIHIKLKNANNEQLVKFLNSRRACTVSHRAAVCRYRSIFVYKLNR